MTINIILVICCVCFIFLLQRNIRQSKKDKEEIIQYLQNMLEGVPNDYSCYEDNEKSRISYLLKKLEANIQLSQDEAHREKEGIKYMIANLSHQLKTPLANIKMYEDFLEDNTLLVNQREQFQKKLRNQIGKIEWILGSIIKCARLEEGAISFEAEMYPIKRTIMQAMDTVALQAADKNIEIISTEHIGENHLYHNQKWTREVFENILENAIKYSPEGSIIKISITQMETYTKIVFEDNGIGIKEEEYVKIFQRFYRSKDVENAEGSGIGLYLCRLILEKEKGNIVVESKYGKGSKFSVFLLNKPPQS